MSEVIHHNTRALSRKRKDEIKNVSHVGGRRAKILVMDETLTATVAEANRDARIAAARSKNRTNRFGPRMFNYLRMWFGTPTQRRRAYGALQIGPIRYWEDRAAKMTDQEILAEGR